MTGLLAAAVLAVPLLLISLIGLGLTIALQTYSRSLLEELCEDLGHPERAVQIVQDEERTERACDMLSLVCVLLAASLLGWALASSDPRLEFKILLVMMLFLAGVGYLLSKAYGRAHAEWVLAHHWPLAQLIEKGMWPLVQFSRWLESLIWRKTRPSASAQRPASVEVEVHSSGMSGEFNLARDLPEATREQLERVVELAGRDVADLVVPRSAMVMLPATVSPKAAAAAFVESGHSRLPIHGEHRDDIIGILYAKDLLPCLLDNAPLDCVATLARPPYFVPESKNAAELLDEFRSRRVQMAIVLDEFGSVTGLITLEDLLEEIVGPIDDEHDKPTPADFVLTLGDGQYQVDASVAIEDLNERLDLHLPLDEDYQTLGGFVMANMGRIPQEGETFQRHGVKYTVLEVSGHTVRRVQIDLPTTKSAVEA